MINGRLKPVTMMMLLLVSYVDGSEMHFIMLLRRSRVHQWRVGLAM